MLELNPKTRIHTIWFVGDEIGDVLAALWRTAEGEWLFSLRIRTADPTGDPDPHSPQNTDRKRGLTAKLTPEHVADLDAHARHVRKEVLEPTAATRRLLYGTRCTVEEIRLDCPGDEAGERLMAMNLSWFHVGPAPTQGAADA